MTEQHELPEESYLIELVDRYEDQLHNIFLVEDEYKSDFLMHKKMQAEGKESTPMMKGALWAAINLCAREQIPIPDWAAEEIKSINYRLQAGTLHDFNEAFCFEHTNITTRAKELRFREYWIPVLKAVRSEHEKNKPIDDELYALIALQLGITVRQVKGCYKFGKQALSLISQNSSQKSGAPSWTESDLKIMDLIEESTNKLKNKV